MSYIFYNPHEPGSRGRALWEFYVKLFAFWGTVGSIIYYICSLVSLFKGNYSKNLLYSIGLIVLMSIVFFLCFFSEIFCETTVISAKNYFLFFVGGILDLSAIVGIIVSIASLCHNGEGIPLLIYSVFGVLGVTIVVVILYRKFEGYEQVKLFADKKILLEIKKENASQSIFVNTQAFIQNNCKTSCFYCHRCGEKLPYDSKFCSSCGTKLK